MMRIKVSILPQSIFNAATGVRIKMSISSPSGRVPVSSDGETGSGMMPVSADGLGRAGKAGCE